GWPISSIICAAFSSWSELTPQRSNPKHETFTLLKTQSENQVNKPASNTQKKNQLTVLRSLQLKHFRRFATRYDRRTIHFTGFNLSRSSHDLERLNVDYP
ncbi:hypothetical protein, partial [Acetobacter senegalensis]